MIIAKYIYIYIVFGGNFNLIFDFKFDMPGGNPILKKSL